MYRQGDVLMKTIAIPADAQRVMLTERAVMAYGEVTGHAHVLDQIQDIELYEKEGRTFVRVLATTPLTHEEHGTIMLVPGDYERIIQREYSPEAIRNVQD